MATKLRQDGRERAEAPAQSNVYEEKRGKPNFNKLPHCIYFFHVGPPDPATGESRILHYYDRGDDQPIDTDEKLQARLGALIRNAREPNESNRRPPPYGADFKFMVMDRVSYVAFAFDFEVTGTPTMDVSPPNHSFFDARYLRVEGCDMLACINHMKGGPNGANLGHASRPFNFRLITNPPILLRGGGRPDDSGGTNTGPRVPPPEDP